MLRKFIFAVVWLALLGGMALTGCSTDDNPVAEEEGLDGGSLPDGVEKRRPSILPAAELYRDVYIINKKNSTLRGESKGYGFDIKTDEIKWKGFSCYLMNQGEDMTLASDVTVELTGSVSEMYFGEGRIKGNGVIKLKGDNWMVVLISKDTEVLQRMAGKFTAAEGYKINKMGVSDWRNGEKNIAKEVELRYR